MKLFFTLFVLLILTVLIVFSNNRVRVYVTLFSLFFPIHLQFMGRDAMTTGTICIGILYLTYLIESFKRRNFIKERFDFWIYLLVLFGAISIIFAIWTGMLEKDQIGHAVRQHVSFFSAILFFLVIKNYRQDNFQSYSKSYNNHFEKLLSLFLLFISLHILLSIGVKFFPSLGSYYKIFLSRDIDVFDIYGRGKLERITSFVFTPEIYGEIIAVLSPIVLYKILKSRNMIWVFCLLLFSYGEILAVTRSGILLFIFGVIFSLLYHFRTNFGKTYALTYFLSTGLFLLIYFYPAIFGDLFLRFGGFIEDYKSSGNILKAINRPGFPDIWDYVISNLTLFGHSMARVDFHNLFFTTLHQLGIFGTFLFFTVLLYPAVRLIKSTNKSTSANTALTFSCLLSIGLFLINESKFEFTRHAGYQQICWGLFATYYLVSKNPLQKKDK